MAASDHLSPVQFFHGSTENWKRGQVIDPSQPHRKNFASSEDSKFYMDERREKATEFAGLLDAAPKSTYMHPDESRRAVYTVQPLGPVQRDSHRGDAVNYDPDDHDTAWETSHPVRVVGKHFINDRELYGD